MDYTKGKWEIIVREELEIHADGSKICTVYDIEKDDDTLIIEAVNACIEYDSENPLRFIEDAKRAIELVKLIRQDFGLLPPSEGRVEVWIELAQKALEKKTMRTNEEILANTSNNAYGVVTIPNALEAMHEAQLEPFRAINSNHPEKVMALLPNIIDCVDALSRYVLQSSIYTKDIDVSNAVDVTLAVLSAMKEGAE